MYDKLRSLRLKEGYTLQKMSTFLGYSSPNAYARKEKGERKFNLEEIQVISNVFGRTVEEIFFTNEVPKKGNGKNTT